MTEAKPMRKIFLVIGTLDIGGSEVQVVTLARELRAAGQDVTVVVLGGPGPLAAELNGLGIPTRHLSRSAIAAPPEGGFAKLRRSLRKGQRGIALLLWLIRERPHVVHAFLFYPSAIALPLSWLARVPVRVSARRNLRSETQRSLFGHLAQRLRDLSATAITANSLAVAAVARASGCPPRKLVVIPNGVDIPPAAAEPARQPVRVVMIANLIPYKGHADVLEAWALLDDPPQLHIYGDGPCRPGLEADIGRLGLGGVVHLHGSVRDAKDRYLDAQISLSASHEEGLPNALMEAMAAGLPVVATSVGGVPELVREGVDGLLVPPRSPAALASAVSQLLASPDLRSRMGGAGRARMRDDYSWDACLRAHANLYAAGRREVGMAVRE